jgi:NitT/TauT family transport system ATP-binding protein
VTVTSSAQAASSAASSAGGGVALRIDGVGKTYTRRGRRRREAPKPAITGVDLDVRPGEFLGIVGPSGCGKSTLLQMVAGLVGPTEGTITIDGSPVDGPHPDLGYVFQSSVMLDWRTVLGNVLLQGELRGGADAAFRARAEELLGSVGLGDWLHHYPYELSGGMRQRAAICRALVHQPRLLLMDEPFGALDAFTRDQLNVDVQRMWRRSGCTTVFVTHSITEAVFLSDRVVVLAPHPGRVLRVAEIDLPRPRRIADRNSPEFVRYVKELEADFAGLGVLTEEASEED